jgi:3-dehydrosphinganine reductase
VTCDLRYILDHLDIEMPSTSKRHVLVTGGSKGIGLAIAVQFLRNPGANTDKISLLARNEKDLIKAKKQLLDEFPHARVEIVVADTTEAKLKDRIAEAQEALGPIDVLVCNAGLSIPKLIMESTVEDYERQINVNYLGAVRSVHAVLPGMVARRSGHIILVSSVMGVLGFAGYSSYAPSKWAIRGFADCLRNELRGTGVGVSVAYPPDTQTPGYAMETEMKAELCVQVNEALGSTLYGAERVAAGIVRGYVKGCFHIPPPDLGSTLLISTMTSLTRPGVFWMPIQMLLAPLLLLVRAFLTWKIDSVAERYWAKSEVKGDETRARASGRRTRARREQ